MRSMTGFGRASRERDGNTVTVEISAVNSKRQAEIRLTMARELNCTEPAIRKHIASRVSRGGLAVTLAYDLAAQYQRQRVQVDRHLAAAVIEQLRDLAVEHDLELQIAASDLLAVPGILAERALPPPEEVCELILETLDLALDDLQSMQTAEGAAMRTDLTGRCTKIQAALEAVAGSADEILRNSRNRLRDRIQLLGVELPVDDERLVKELAFAAERSDTTEELVRLQSHIVQFTEALNEQETPGRQLEFLCQEMGREVNTLCAKTTDTGVATLGLEIKSELGRIREQVQNIE